jgi:hypothetical protein
MVETKDIAGGNVAQTDSVVQKLVAAGDDHAASALHWLDAKQERRALRLRATWCVVAGWLLVTAALGVGAFVAWNFSLNAEDLFDGKMPVVSIVLPPTLIFLTCVSFIGGLFALFAQAFPGLASTNQAIDWSGTGDAVSRLLAAGCTYPDAYRTAAEVASTATNRNWLNRAATRIDQGASPIGESPTAAGDAAVVELLIQANESDPSQSWRAVANHFIEIARSRLALLLSTAPIIATLLAGLIVWLSISSTLGAMWRHALQSIGSLS